MKPFGNQPSGFFDYKSSFISFQSSVLSFCDEQNVRHPEPVEGCEITSTVCAASFDEAQDGKGGLLRMPSDYPD